MASIMCILIVNINLKSAVYDSIPKNQFNILLLRSVAAAVISFVDYSTIKYINLAFQAITTNLTPIPTSILSWYMTGEVSKNSDIAFMILSMIAASMVTVGVTIFAGFHVKQSNPIVVISTICALINPVIIAWTNVVTSQIKNLNQSTISCYIYPITAIFMLFIIVSK